MINKCLWSGKSLNSDHADCACGLYVYTPVSPEVTRPHLVSVYLFSAFRSYLLMLSVHSCNYIFIYALKKGTFCLNLNCFFLQFFLNFQLNEFFSNQSLAWALNYPHLHCIFEHLLKNFSKTWMNDKFLMGLLNCSFGSIAGR